MEVNDAGNENVAQEKGGPQEDDFGKDAKNPEKPENTAPIYQQAKKSKK